MLSKSFTLFATLAALAPVFAVPVSHGVVTPVKLPGDLALPAGKTNAAPSHLDVRSIVDLNAIVTNVLNDADIRVLSTRDDSYRGCSEVEVTAIVKDVLNNADVKIGSSSKRDSCDYAVVTADVKNVLNNLKVGVLSSQSKRSEGCTDVDIDATIKNIANNMDIKVLTAKRSACDFVELNAVVKDVLENLHVTVLSESKRDEYSMGTIVQDVKSALRKSQNGSIKAKRDDADTLVSITATLKDILNRLRLNVITQNKRDSNVFTLPEINAMLEEILKYVIAKGN